MKNIGTTTFAGIRCAVLLGQYPGGRLALQLDDACTHEPVLTASVNLPQEPLAEDEVILKTYSEGAGIDQALRASGLIEPPHRYVRVGYALAAVVRLRNAS